MFHKIKSIKPLPDYCLFVHFENGEIKQYDIKKIAKELEQFNALFYIPSLFEQVKIDTGGYGIFWNDEIDLACNELYYNGVPLSSDPHPDTGVCRKRTHTKAQTHRR